MPDVYIISWKTKEGDIDRGYKACQDLEEAFAFIREAWTLHRIYLYGLKFYRCQEVQVEMNLTCKEIS